MFTADELTISVSDTGPKLVTKIFVVISVTFSVERAQLRMYEVWGGQRKAMKSIIIFVNCNWSNTGKKLAIFILDIFCEFVSSPRIWDILPYVKSLLKLC